MAYYSGRRRYESVFDAFSLSPVPYPVLLILLTVFFLLGVSWFFSYESFMEDAEEQMSWLLLAAPLVLLLLIRWLSSFQGLDGIMYGVFSSYDGSRRRTYYYNRPPAEGSSPWGVAAIVALLLVLVYFQSSFQDMWGP